MRAQPPFLLVTRDTVRFNPAGDCWLDVAAFGDLAQAYLCRPVTASPGPPDIERIEDGLALYRGPFLESFSIPDSAAFEEWALLQREQLHHQAMELLGCLTTACEEAVQIERALGHARRQLELDAWREESHQQVIRLLARAGKTHLAVALGMKAVEAGYSALFLTLESLMTRLVRAKYENRLDRALQQLSYPKLLIIDEIGYLPLSREEASLFFRLVVRRYERASLIVTSNKSFLDWGEVFSDPVLATAILDRLLHYSTTLNIKGESYRLKEKRRAGLLGRPKPIAETPEEVPEPT
jgi:hypothetical protein